MSRKIKIFGSLRSKLSLITIITFAVHCSLIGQAKEDCIESVFGVWSRTQNDTTLYWDFIRKKEGLVADYTQGVLIQSMVNEGKHVLTKSMRFFWPADDQIMMTETGTQIDTFSMSLSCEKVILRKINKGSKPNDTIHLNRAVNFPYQFDRLYVYCPPKPIFKGLADFYFNFFTYLKTIRLQYYFSILALTSVLILIRYFSKMNFLLSVLLTNTIQTLLWIGLLYGSSFIFLPQYTVMYVCDVSAQLFPKFMYYTFASTSVGLEKAIPKDSMDFWVFSIKTIFFSNIVFSVWIAWRKHFGQFNFKKWKIIGPLADIFLQFSVPLSIIMVSSGYALVTLIGVFTILSSHNFIVFFISALAALLYCKKILIDKYFFFDPGENKTIVDFVVEKIKEAFTFR